MPQWVVYYNTVYLCLYFHHKVFNHRYYLLSPTPFSNCYEPPKATLNIKYSRIRFLSLATNIGAKNLWYLLYYARVSVVIVVLLLCVLTCQVCASLVIINSINNFILLSISIINDLYSFVGIFCYKFFS